MSNAIKRAREAAGLSQTQLTQLTGLSQAVLSRLERGYTSIDRATIATMRKIAKALDTTIDALVNDE